MSERSSGQHGGDSGPWTMGDLDVVRSAPAAPDALALWTKVGLACLFLAVATPLVGLGGLWATALLGRLAATGLEASHAKLPALGLLDRVEARLAEIEPVARASIQAAVTTERAELLLGEQRPEAALALLGPLEDHIEEQWYPERRAGIRIALAHATRMAGGAEAEVRRLANQAAADLRAAHLVAQADAVTQWLARRGDDAPAARRTVARAPARSPWPSPPAPSRTASSTP